MYHSLRTADFGNDLDEKCNELTYINYILKGNEVNVKCQANLMLENISKHNTRLLA